MPRLTAPNPRQITRAINTAVGASSARNIDHHADAVLMPKPTPQPSIINRSKPLMQTFSTSPASSATPLNHLDTFFLPTVEALTTNPQAPDAPSVPILPDNMSAVQLTADAPVLKPGVTIIACDPDRVVSSSALSEVDGLDGVVLNFALAQQAEDESHQGMVKDLWKGL